MAHDVCTVGALAHLAGVSPDSIRHYERIGILPTAARSQGGYRVWVRRDVEYLKWLAPAKRAGFALRELAGVFRMYREGVPPCHTVQELLQQKLGQLDAEIAALSAFRRELSRVHRRWARRLERSRSGEFVHLLDDLHDLPPVRRAAWLGAAGTEARRRTPARTRSDPASHAGAMPVRPGAGGG